uniref:Uncharacterized protein n=1 Tax=Arundo donax TaxID=35708 RepID=A0A0A9ELT9_ARUDO
MLKHQTRKIKVFSYVPCLRNYKYRPMGLKLQKKYNHIKKKNVH